jgi:hypothetical protein
LHEYSGFLFCLAANLNWCAILSRQLFRRWRVNRVTRQSPIALRFSPDIHRQGQALCKTTILSPSLMESVIRITLSACLSLIAGNACPKKALEFWFAMRIKNSWKAA